MILDSEFKTKAWVRYKKRNLETKERLNFKFDSCYIHYTECDKDVAKITVECGMMVIDLSDIECAVSLKLDGNADVTIIGNLAGITIDNDGMGSVTAFRTRYHYYVNRRYTGSFIEPTSLYERIKLKVNKWLSLLKN